MGFKCGIVGLPNVGKSTLFNALTKAGIEAQNYPFCTIEPNVGMVAVPDERLNKIAALAASAKVIPASMQFVDIAGLVAGAAQGEGLGNQFLAHIRETQAIAHVVRCFEDKNITHVADKIDPLSDIETIHTELAIRDYQTLEKVSLKLQKDVKAKQKDAALTLDLCRQVMEQLDQAELISSLKLSMDEQQLLAPYQLLTAKPICYIANVDEASCTTGNHFVEAVEALAEKQQARVVVISAAIEAEIAELEHEEQVEYCQSLGLEEPGLNRLIKTGYELLGLQTYFTAGPKEARAWTIPINASAPQAAGAIHTDFERGFIKAEVISYDDFIAHQGESGAKDAGKWRQEGKDYIVHDGDVICFRFNV